MAARLRIMAKYRSMGVAAYGGIGGSDLAALTE
jgi:hypothetical protein